MAQLSVSASELRCELRALTAEGILHRRMEGRFIFYELDAACPSLPELRELLLTTADLVEVLREALQPHRSRIAVAFLFGPVILPQDTVTSPIELFVIGELESEELAPPLRAAEIWTGRLVAPTIYTPARFARDLREDAPSLKDELAGEKVFVIGGPDDLDRLAQATEIMQHPPTRQQRINARFRGTALATFTTGFAAIYASALFYPQSLDQPSDRGSPPATRIRSGIDPNKAAWYELAQLPGIGETRAKTIVEHREGLRRENGDASMDVFRSPQDMIVIRGIGDRTVRRLTPFLCFSSKSEEP